MELTHPLVVYLLASLSARLCATLAHVEDEAAGSDKEITPEDEQKVYDECRNPDYKKYVKCLMRPKRHYHAGHVGDGTSDTDARHCLETCLQKCDFSDHDCEKNCSHCIKRTRHRHQIITEYETECVSGKCGPLGGELRTTNITTNIGINNYINYNGTQPRLPIPPNGGKPHPPLPPNGGDGKPVNGHYPPGYPPPGYPPTDGWFPSVPIVPQISLVPQITYGVGFGAAGGCAYSQWLCIQRSGVKTVQPDCSVCGNPILRYKCDVTCYKSEINVTLTQPLCKSPECVGGST